MVYKSSTVNLFYKYAANMDSHSVATVAMSLMKLTSM